MVQKGYLFLSCIFLLASHAICMEVDINPAQLEAYRQELRENPYVVHQIIENDSDADAGDDILIYLAAGARIDTRLNGETLLHYVARYSDKYFAKFFIQAQEYLIQNFGHNGMNIEDDDPYNPTNIACIYLLNFVKRIFASCRVPSDWRACGCQTQKSKNIPSLTQLSLEAVLNNLGSFDEDYINNQIKPVLRARWFANKTFYQFSDVEFLRTINRGLFIKLMCERHLAYIQYTLNLKNEYRHMRDFPGSWNPHRPMYWDPDLYEPETAHELAERLGWSFFNNVRTIQSFEDLAEHEDEHLKELARQIYTFYDNLFPQG